MSPNLKVRNFKNGNQNDETENYEALQNFLKRDTQSALDETNELRLG
jgi:hypothetical protein